MQTVAKELWTNSMTVKNSKFETFITQVNNIEEVTFFLKHYQDNKASHNCYAYIIGFEKKVKRFDDNGEPNKSAGFAILKVLEEKKLTNIIVLVRRYFQPPKLGIGHLMRAYQCGLLQYLDQKKLLAIIPSKKYFLITPINLINLIYHKQKQYQFLILAKEIDNLKVIFTINFPNNIENFFYHSDIEVIFIEDSFLVINN